MTERKFLCYYRYLDKTWAIEIYATNWHDAGLRLAAIKESIAIVGEIMEEGKSVSDHELMLPNYILLSPKPDWN